MREIKFRARVIDNSNKWVIGSYIHTNERDQIICLGGQTFDIDPKTVGQYVGLHDKNGVDIYGGDIINRNGDIGYVVFISNGFLLRMRKHSLVMIIKDTYKNIEVIGNIYKNKDLLNNQKKDENSI